MSQHDQNIANGPGLAVRTDINNALLALFSSSSGDTEPTVKLPGQLWFDTLSVPAVLKLRNEANTAWDAVPTSTGSFLPTSGGTMTGDIILPGTPANPLGAAPRSFVEGLLSASGTHPSARLATVANNALNGLANVDGIAPLAGNRILVRSQTAPAENGVYIAAAGPWVRATDMDAWAEFVSAVVWVTEGATNASTGWLCTVGPTGTVGTDAIPFTKIAGANAFQPLNAYLTSIAALVADGMVRKVGNVASVIDIVTAAIYRAATPQRVLTNTDVWAAAAEVTIAYAATVAPDNATFINALITATGALQIANFTNPVPGRSGVIRVVNGTAGALAATWGANVKFAGGSKPSSFAVGETLLSYYVTPSYVAMNAGSAYA
jgi:hypothetical protein